MDPDKVLEQLRELYNSWQDGHLGSHEVGLFIEAFDNLDNWIISGGFLPKEWEVSRE